MDDVLSTVMRQEIAAIMREVKLAEMNRDELDVLFDLMNEVRRRVRARPQLSIVPGVGPE